MKTRAGQVLAAASLVAMVVVSAHASPDPHTFSIDAVSPSLNDPADLLNPGMSVQVFKVNLGLAAGDELDALSSGNDAVQLNNIAFFSVDRNSMGLPGPWTPLDVNGQALLNQQAGDIFVTTNGLGVWAVPQGINDMHVNQHSLGEIPIAGPAYDNTGNLQDNLDALSFEEFDLVPPVGNGVQDRPVHFSLAVGSPSLGGVFSAADILISPAGGGPFGGFAAAGQMGLLFDDDLDALALLDLNADGVATVGIDAALFSLAPGSPTLLAMGASPADVFLTTFNGLSAVRYTALSLGLLPEDNVDALEVQVPEPATLALLGLGGLAMLLKRRR